MKIQLSVIVLTHNECERIERCLASIRRFSQIIIIDSFSEDKTLEKARDLWRQWEEPDNALTLVSRAWPGFTQARNDSLKWVSNPWVLWLDADEWISNDFVNFCEKLTQKTFEDKIYEFPRQSYFLGRKIKYGGWYPDYKKRLAPTQSAIWKKGPQESDVHEDLYLKSSSKKIERVPQVHIFHEGFRDEIEQKQTNELYSTLLAQGLSKKWKINNVKPPSDFYIFLKPIVKFIENYLYKLGFLDGVAGLKIALGSAWSIQQRLLKAKLLYNNNQTSEERHENSNNEF